MQSFDRSSRIPAADGDVRRWRRINRLLVEALALPGDQRERWLESMALEDRELVPTLRSLLAREAAETDEFMNRSAHAVWRQAVGADAPDALAGQEIGPYRLLRQLGAGGMGTVWLAERADGKLKRKVAIKLPLHGWAPGVAERLSQERDTLAALEHPNIARLYDAGVTATGRPYLAMEYVDGLPIDVFAVQHRLSVRARLELFLQVTRAVAYAHARMIVHRDLKPSNIFVARYGEVRLLDFGAAKLLRDDGPQESALTREVGRAFSPEYASPEQICQLAITAASDVYSLGVVLYELLTGKRPYALNRCSAAGLEAAIVAAEVPAPSSAAAQDRKLNRELRGDLDNIVLMALKKEPRDRYLTVTELADDLRRWIRHEPVLARRDGIAYRAQKFLRRNWAPVSAAAVVFVALTAAAAVTSMQMIEARKQRDEARLQAKHAQAAERFANMVMEQSGPNGRPLTREEMIDRSVELLDQQYGDDPRFIAAALIPISGRYMDLGNTTKELAALEKAEGIARRLQDRLLLTMVQCNAVETELAEGSLDRAERRMSEARMLLARLPASLIQPRVDCIHAEASLADAHGDTARAIERIEEAIGLQERADRTDLTYRALLSHAQMLYLHACRPKDAYAVIEKTLAVLRRTDAKNNEALSGAMHNESVALLQMGEVRAALVRERESLAMAVGDHVDEPVAPALANVLGRLYTRMNRTSEGVVWEERSLASARVGGNVDAQVYALTALAETRAYRGDLRAARAASDEAASLMKQTSDPRERAAVERARAVVSLSEGDLPAAQAAAALLLKAIGYPDEQRVRTAPTADLQLLLAARIALTAGQPRYARHLIEDALAIASTLARDPQRSATVGEARLLLAQAMRAQGDAPGAHAVFQGAVAALRAGLAPDHPLAVDAAAFDTGS